MVYFDTDKIDRLDRHQEKQYPQRNAPHERLFPFLNKETFWELYLCFSLPLQVFVKILTTSTV